MLCCETQDILDEISGNSVAVQLHSLTLSDCVSMMPWKRTTIEKLAALTHALNAWSIELQNSTLCTGHVRFSRVHACVHAVRACARACVWIEIAVAKQRLVIRDRISQVSWDIRLRFSRVDLWTFASHASQSFLPEIVR